MGERPYRRKSQDSECDDSRLFFFFSAVLGKKVSGSSAYCRTGRKQVFVGGVRVLYPRDS